MINTINNKVFRNANTAYEYLHDQILQHGVDFGDTKALFNVGFYMTDPMDNKIINREREWKEDYAEAEWQWYLTGDPKISTLGEIYGKVPEIWKRMANDIGQVNSNYGYQWERNDQLERIITDLTYHKDTRQATISIYDGKEIKDYARDTPCTYAVQFTRVNNRLDMCVTMRSNDLWYGFCNDQYCFSRLQEMVSKRLNINPGVYYHFAHNMHLYNDKI
jgi:thymidylate synthase|tara:strand:+ start:332 stop:988 length:657 start_codon:yes stop_codon:yes gene_type:complete